MELLNHFVATRLMKEAQFFERMGRHDTTQKLLGRSKPQVFPVDEAGNPRNDEQPSRPLAQPNACPATDDAQMRHSG